MEEFYKKFLSFSLLKSTKKLRPSAGVLLFFNYPYLIKKLYPKFTAPTFQLSLYQP